MEMLATKFITQLPIVVVLIIGMVVILTRINQLNRDINKLYKMINDRFRWCTDHFVLKQ